MKKFFFSMFAALMCMSAFAADVMKGVNQNGYQASVGYDQIATAKHAGGVTSWRASVHPNASVYTISDATGSQFNAWLTFVGGNAKTSSVTGWTYNVRKTDISCQYAKSVVVKDGTEEISDNCALANSI